MELSQELKEINKLKQEIHRLQDIVDSLCMTNFLVDYQDGDEEVRDAAKKHVNRQRHKIVTKYNASKEHNELWHKRKEITDRMIFLEQDFPHLRDIV